MGAFFRTTFIAATLSNVFQGMVFFLPYMFTPCKVSVICSVYVANTTSLCIGSRFVSNGRRPYSRTHECHPNLWTAWGWLSLRSYKFSRTPLRIYHLLCHRCIPRMGLQQGVWPIACIWPTLRTLWLADTVCCTAVFLLLQQMT